MLRRSRTTLSWETDVLVPNYMPHNSSGGAEGFGDTSVSMKYRIASGNQAHGTYLVSTLLMNTWTTGSAKKGAVSPPRAIAINGGKVFGIVGLEGALRVTLPAPSGLASLGRPPAWNTTVEAHVARHVRTEIEPNSTF
jgi:hypothetical protein